MPKTIKKLLASAADSVDPLDAELLLAHVLNKPREFVVAHPEKNISIFKILKFQRLVKKRKAGWPLAYLLGYKNFFGLDFLVNKHTLIPRPETELLVELVIEEIKGLSPCQGGVGGGETRSPQKIFLIDVGTGTGCIPISIATAMKQFNNLTIYASDISNKALKIAKKNATKHNVHINFLHGNLLEPIIKQLQQLQHLEQLEHIIITANLPYLTEEQFKSEPTIKHEPKSALVAKKGGLALYEELLKQIEKIVTGYRLQVTTFFEIDPDQSEPIQPMIKTYLPNANIEIKKDLCGRDRVVRVWLKNL